MKPIRLITAACGCLALAGSLPAQSVISAKSGMINYSEGTVLLDGKPVASKFGVFPSVGNSSELRTEDGRAEVLLGPGVFLRLGENSSFRMISDRLSDTRVEFAGGTMVLERAEVSKDEALQILYKDKAIALAKDGVYRFESEPARLMVYDGEARVTEDGKTLAVKKAKMLPLTGSAVVEKFDSKSTDPLLRWARRRSEYLAMANVSAARSISRNGGWGSSGWVFNPAFGMFTYVPMSGFYQSFWGYSYWSPGEVWSAYVPRRTYGGGGAVSGLPSSGSGQPSGSAGSGSPGTPSRGGSGRVSPSPAPPRPTAPAIHREIVTPSPRGR